jgi:tetratricopeptide (TPR) repeat protein
MLSFIVSVLAAQASAVPAPSSDIVVRARRVGAALSTCVAHGCSTAEDIRLSIALAEAQVVNGDYNAAQHTLNAAIARNKGAAKTYPRMVAALYEASGTVSLHRGDMDKHRSALIGQSKTLRDNLPSSDPQVLLLSIEQGDYYAQRGNWREAERRYAAAEQGYAEAQQPRLAALAALRSAYLAFARKNLQLSESRLRVVAAMPAANDPAVAQLRAVLGARIASARGEGNGIESLLATLRTDPAAAPVLLHETTAEASAAQAAAQQSERFLEPNPAGPGSSEVSPIQWADIGYMVASDGTVSEVDVLRGSRDLRWTAPFVKQIASRRYAPLALAPGQPGLYRVERLTWRAQHVVPVGSLIKRAAGAKTLRVLDLTKVAAPPPS